MAPRPSKPSKPYAPRGKPADRGRPKGALSLDRMMQGKNSTHVSEKKIIARKEKRHFVTKFKRELRKDERKPSDSQAERPSFYDKILSSHNTQDDDIELIPREKSATDDVHQAQLHPSRTQAASRPSEPHVRGKKPPAPKVKKADPYAKERAKFLAQKEERERLQQEREFAQRQKAQQLKDSRQKRTAQSRMLQKKTRKGQPVLANQIEHLLGKLQREKATA